MRVKANISFCGSVCMAAGEIRDIPEGGVLTDLLNAGYVERLDDKPLEEEPAGDKSEEDKPADEEPEPVTEKPKGAKNEAKRGKS